MIYTVLIPLIICFGYYIFISQISFIKKLSVLEKICMSPLIGLTFIVLLPTLWGIIFPSGLVLLQKLIFCIGFFGLVLLLFRLLKDLLNRQKLLLNWRKLLSSVVLKINGERLVGFTLILIFVILGRLLLLNILRPLVDPDIIESYLPFARTLQLSDKIPLYSYYSNTPFTIPPVGGPMYLSFFYSVANSLLTESFRLSNFPFFIISLIIFYQLFRKQTNVGLSLLSILVVVSLPIVEDLFFEAAVYPEFIFLYLFGISIYFLTKLYEGVKKDQSGGEIILIGLSLSLMLLFKYQAIFIWLIVFAYLMLIYLPGLFKYSGISIILLPFIKQDLFPYKTSSDWFLVTIVLSIFFFWIYVVRRYRQNLEKKEISFFQLLIFSILTLTGFVFIARNWLVFGGLNDTSSQMEMVRIITRNLGLVVNTRSENIMYIFALFLAQDLGLYLFIFKVVGLIYAMRARFVYWLFVLFVYFVYWIIFMGAEASRWLLPIIPFLCFFSVYGASRILSGKKLPYALWLSSLFAFFSSKFFFWNLAFLVYGSETVRSFTSGGLNNISMPLIKDISVLNGVPSLVSRIKVVSILFLDSLYKHVNNLFYVLTSRSEEYSSHLILLIVWSVVTSLGMVLFARLLAKKLVYLLLCVFLLGTYFYIFIRIGSGNPSDFALYEQKHIFNYWGMTNNVVPYIKANINPGEKIFVWGLAPGLSYYTNSSVYNLENGYGLALISSRLMEPDKENINEFLKSNSFNYIIISQRKDSNDRFLVMRKNTKIFDIIDDPKYFSLVLDSNKESFWKVYKRI